MDKMYGMTHAQEEKAEEPFFKTGKHPSKKEMAKKMMESKSYTHTRCGKCNRFGHSHEKCGK